MTDNKYNYNPHTLEFEKTGYSKTKKLVISAISIFIGAIFIFIIIFIVFSYYYEAKIAKNPQSEYHILEKQYIELLERKKQNDKYLSKLIEKDKKIFQVVFKSSPDNNIFEKKSPYSKFLNADIKSIINENNTRLSAIDLEANKQKEDYRKILEIVKNTHEDKLRYIPAIQPVFNKALNFPVYGFGNRIDQVYKTLVPHPGIDYATPIGTPIFATADGKVEKSGRKRGLGKRIIINHNNGYKTVYAHLGNIDINKGNKVKRGDKIGTVGMTGKTLIPHLHYEINYKGKPINPVNYFFLDLNPDEFYKIRMQSAKSGLSLD